MFFKS